MTMRYVFKFFPCSEAEKKDAKKMLQALQRELSIRSGNPVDYRPDVCLQPIVEGADENGSFVKMDSYIHINVPTKNLDFGHAIELLKQGYKLARKGWNGKNMWLRYVKQAIPWGEWEGKRELFELGENDVFLPWIGMKTADNKFVPWLASQTDILAEDWEVVE